MPEASRFRVQLADDSSRWVELPDKGTLVLGSSKERAGFLIDGQGVEDAHCAIGRIKGGGYAIKDLGTRYGTLVNGKKVGSARLKHDDEITLGATRLRVFDTAQAASEEAPAKSEPLATSESRAEAALEPAPLSSEERAQRKGPQASNKPERPDRIGGFRIERLLGRGGMGNVYLAVQENLDRPVALKVLSPKRAADAEFVDRFQAEARAAAALHHPNVVIVHDVGEADGRHFLSMEYMPGGSLEERVSGQGPLPWRSVLDVLYDAARGLEFAEGKGIVHRDIKPANLMVDSAGTTKIADLGLATGTESEESDGGKIFGTPHFISPEQARGEAVDGRSDLYSLGATAYRLITGRTPFEGESAREILRGHFTQTPVKIDEVPEAVNALVQKLLAKEPSERFGNAAELASAIDGLRVVADHGTPQEEESGGSKKVLIAVAVVAFVAAAVFGSGLLGRGSDPDEVDATSSGHAQVGESDAPAEDPGDEASEDFFGEKVEEGPAVDEESELRVLELQAELAYSKLDPGLDRASRIAALEELAATHPTTTTAGRAQAEIEELRGEQRREEAAERRRVLALSGATDALKAAASWPPPEGTAPDPANALTGLSSYRPTDELAASPEYPPLYAAVFGEIVSTCTAFFEAEVTRVEGLLAKGEFGEARTAVMAMEAPLTLPEPASPGAVSSPSSDTREPATNSAEQAATGDETLPLRIDVPAEHTAAYAALRQFAVRRAAIEDQLAEREEEWKREQVRADELLLASALGPEGEGARLLRDRDFASLAERIDQVATALRTETARARLGTLTTELPFASTALTALVDGFPGGEWRRQTIIDSTGRRTKNREAIGTRPEGILIDRGGEPELRRWRVFGPREVHQLFKARLSRAYTAEEQRGIVALLVIAAIADVQEIVERHLSPERRGIFRPEDAERMSSAFAEAKEWIDENPEVAPEAIAFLRREEQTALILAKALLASEEGRWAQAVSALERLFGEGGESFLFALFSNGQEWRQPRADRAASPSGSSGSGGSAAPGEDG